MGTHQFKEMTSEASHKIVKSGGLKFLMMVAIGDESVFRWHDYANGNVVKN